MPFDILVAVEQTYDDRITRRLVAQRVAPAARVILSQTQLSAMEVIDVNAGALAASLSLARCGYLFVLQRPRTLVQTGPT